MKTFDPIVSVIVPCYNVEPYVKCLLDSLLTNDYLQKELILVDDGSTDKTLSILIDYQKRYPDIIKVIHKENGGVASARNVGLDYAIGAYVMFADPDDKVFPFFIETAAKAIDAGYDLVAFGYEQVVKCDRGGGG